MKLPVLLSFLILSFHAFAQPTDLKLASDVWPPFTNVGSEDAFALDLVREAMNRNAIAVDVRIVDFDQVILGMQKGIFDGSAAVWYTADRKETMIYSEPYLMNKLVLVGPKGSDVSFTSFEELSGKSLAVVANYAYGQELSEAEGISLVQGGNDQENLLKVLKGEADYMLVDALLIAYLGSYQAEDSQKFLEIGTHPFITKTLHFALRKDLEGAQGLINTFNSEVKKMMADGTYNRILKLNWIEADVDGDGITEYVPSSNQVGISAPTGAYAVNQGGMGPDSSASQRVYIDGVLYESWDDVPAEYKQSVVRASEYERLNFFRFNF